MSANQFSGNREIDTPCECGASSTIRPAVSPSPPSRPAKPHPSRYARTQEAKVANSEVEKDVLGSDYPTAQIPGRGVSGIHANLLCLANCVRALPQDGTNPAVARLSSEAESALRCMTTAAVACDEEPAFSLAAAAIATCEEDAIRLLQRAISCKSVLAKVELANKWLQKNDGDVGAALALLDDAVAAGHPGAMLVVGRCLKEGLGVPRDVRTALRWAWRAAESGFLPAFHELGEWFEMGYPGIPLDTLASFRCYRSAARGGYAPSQLNLAKMYLLAASGEGPLSHSAGSAAEGVDDAKATAKQKSIIWLRLASEGGISEATVLLSRIESQEKSVAAPPTISQPEHSM